MFQLPAQSDLRYVLRAAVALDHAIGGCIQLIAAAQTLQMVESCGLSPVYFARFERVAAGTSTSYAQALNERRRIVIRDIDTDAAFAPHREVARNAGYRSVQTTPLIDSELRTIGILSTYFAEPHHPGPESLAALDRYCLIAALLCEVDQLHQEIVASDRRISTPPRMLPTEAASAAAAARRLLPTLGRPNHNAALHGAASHLETLVRHLRAMARHSYGVTTLPRAALSPMI